MLHLLGDGRGSESPDQHLVAFDLTMGELIRSVTLPSLEGTLQQYWSLLWESPGPQLP
jgi:hypothetical protein